MQSTRPIVFFIVSFVLLWLGLFLGSRIRRTRSQIPDGGESKLISVVEGALLTLFGLLMGFTFSMAVSRYDARKELIVKEANAIGTTWLRTSALEEPTRSQTQQLLRQYVAARIRFLTSGHNNKAMQASLSQTADLQTRLWSLATSYATNHRDPITGLYLSTLNDSIDATEERTAAFENRVPGEAWGLLLFIGFAATVVIGLDATTGSPVLRIMLPFILAGALALTLDMDSPRYGLIKPTQPSMDRLQQQMGAEP